MSITLTIITVVSWLLLLVMVFQYERLDKRMATLSVLTQEMLQNQRALMEHVGATRSDGDEVKRLRQLVASGQVLEAQAAYRAWSGATHKEALLYINALRTQADDGSEPRSVEETSEKTD
ncbi:hypothetical protein JZ785_24695 [Alicyclobacillus curvatus]|nr:hypothetical protein JZ785_24695 [Alicyclobacillus curvatus]